MATRLMARGPGSHIQEGLQDLIVGASLSIGSAWDVENQGAAVGRASMKMTVIEKKAFLPDVEWFQFTPLPREGGPAITIDIIDAETGGARGISANFPDRLIQPGIPQFITGVMTVPGPLGDPVMRDFWERHSGASFKVIVEIMELDPETGEVVQNLAGHEFDNAFEVVAQAEALLVARALTGGGESPTLAVSVA